MRLNFNAEIITATPESRELSGLIVPFGQVGNTSGGEVIFEAGSIVEIDPARVRLLMEHDSGRPVGKGKSFDVRANEGIYGTFEIARTTAGDDLLEEARFGIRDGLSVGASILDYEMNGSIMVVKAAEIIEVSAVTFPAFDSARVVEVKGSEGEPDSLPTLEKEDHQVEDTTPEVVEEVQEVAPVVEASAPIYTSPRRPSADELTAAVIKAARGDVKAQNLITAALDGATTITSPGVIPVSYMTDVISVIDGSRPFINSIRRSALVPSGLSFKKPRWSSYPVVGLHETEYSEIATNDALIEHIDVEVKSRMGGNKISVELLDRSDPSYFNELRVKLAEAYGIHTDSAALETFLASVTAASGTGWAAIVDAVAKVRLNSKRSANRLLLSVDQWASAMQLEDSSGRQLFAPIGQSNANGTLTAFSGTILGLSVVVDDNAPEGTAVVYSDEAATYYEAAGSPAALQATVVSNAYIEVAVKGYDALSLDYTFDGDNFAAYSVTLA